MKLFRNANLIDFESETARNVDLLVDDNGKFVEIGKDLTCKCENIDLQGDYVLPPFVNAYANSNSGVWNSYGSEMENAEKTHAHGFCKNLLAGSIIFNDSINALALENLQDKTEQELDDLCFDLAKTSKKLFLKVGLTLEEMGAVDKEYGKSLCEVLEGFGLLDRGSVIVGGNCFEKDDLRLLANYDTKFVFLPNEDARIGRRAININTLKMLGFDCGIGSGDFVEIDFFGFMRQLLQSQRQMFESDSVLQESDVLKMACNGGLFGDKNKIAPGENANFIVVSRDIDTNDVRKSLVWRKTKRDVVMTIYKGEILQKNGKILMQNDEQRGKILKELDDVVRLDITSSKLKK
ncbi:MAG: amidohydrolase family protein [Clostridia bacterium]|nr:amidohydrolase family protein [Clostridia bacterium]